jgi:hypothetical protein
MLIFKKYIILIYFKLKNIFIKHVKSKLLQKYPYR